jgi:hypothetical protein
VTASRGQKLPAERGGRERDDSRPAGVKHELPVRQFSGVGDAACLLGRNAQDPTACTFDRSGAVDLDLYVRTLQFGGGRNTGQLRHVCHDEIRVTGETDRRHPVFCRHADCFAATGREP